MVYRRTKAAQSLLTLGLLAYAASFLLPATHKPDGGVEFLGWEAATFGFFFSFASLVEGPESLSALGSALHLFGASALNLAVASAPWGVRQIAQGRKLLAWRVLASVAAALAFGVRFTLADPSEGGALGIGYHLWWASEAVVAAALWLLPAAGAKAAGVGQMAPTWPGA